LRNLANVDHFITGYTMGMSIVQGQSDNYVYVKELVKNGPADRNGIRVGDQVVSVDGISLLNLPYAAGLEMLQHTGATVSLIVSQIFNRKPLRDRNSVVNDDDNLKSPIKRDANVQSNLMSTPSKSLPNMMNAKDLQLPKVSLCGAINGD